jgi:hypothetical protein
MAVRTAQEPFLALPVSDAEPVDIAEEILDAVIGFARR